MAPSEKNKAPRPSPASAPVEITDTRTGEVVSLARSGGQTNDLLDAQAAALLGSSELMKALDKAAVAKKEEFSEIEVDFWSPGAVGTPEAVIQGLYVGWSKRARLIQHALVVKQNGKPTIVKLNGRHGLTSALKQFKPKDGVRIEYMGEGVSQGLASDDGQGNKFTKWDVRRISNA